MNICVGGDASDGTRVEEFYILDSEIINEVFWISSLAVSDKMFMVNSVSESPQQNADYREETLVS